MENFLRKHEYNYIKKQLCSLQKLMKGSPGSDVIKANKLHIEDNILNLFSDITNEQKNLFNIENLNDSNQIDDYLAELKNYLIASSKFSNAKISKIFKKEKKLKIPKLDSTDTTNTYLSWVDEGTRKLFVVYNLNDKTVGMACRIPNAEPNKPRICSICNRVSNSGEITFVSPICKTSKNNYRSIGFNMCLDSKKCNNKITSLDKLEEVLKEVNNIK